MQEEVVTTNTIGNVLLDCEEADPVEDNSSGVGLADGVAPSV